MLQNYTIGKSTSDQKVPEELRVALVGLNRISATIYDNPRILRLDDAKIVGFLHIDSLEEEPALQEFPNILGQVGEMEAICRHHKIDRLILAIDPGDVQRLHDIIQQCERASIEYELLSRQYDVDFNGAFSEIFDHKPPPEEYRFQRTLDLLVSVIMFLIFLPSYFLIALAIKLESKGPVLYSQERVGREEKIFRIFKFRSMYADAEKAGPQLAKKRDPRITNVGNFLRKTRLDELPQLINVIRGDMSLVGPRPERPYFVEKYSKIIPRYRERLKVKPGLTGHAQVETGYDETIEDVKEKLQYDLEYIENRNSSSLYWQIMFKTVWVVLTAKGQ
ncbi:MAG TPA: sugar transferase [Calditrichia bacterium]|nr:sugar transferase [Calditrichota bacterium]HQV33857.1 sugar transferase [Calditrichia bacterium]